MRARCPAPPFQKSTSVTSSTRAGMACSAVTTDAPLPDAGPFARDARRGGQVQTHTGWLLYRREPEALAGEAGEFVGDMAHVAGHAAVPVGAHQAHGAAVFA